MTFFKTRKYTFLPLREDGKVETMPFLNAVENSTIPFLELLGSTTFYPVISDIKGNITKLTKKYELDPVKHSTLHDMIDAEIESKTAFRKNSATDALVWLKRTLEFIRGFIHNMVAGDESFKGARLSYEANLKPYHSFLVHGVFSLVMRAMPYRKDIIKLLGQEADEETVLADTKDFMKLFDENIDAVIEIYKARDIDMQFRV
ncbi:glycolipid transfer protein-like isoform X1 [Glandiceps talaboti]